MPSDKNNRPSEKKSPDWRRILRRMIPLGILGVALAIIFASGLGRLINFDAIARQYETLQTLVAAYPLLAPLVTILFYATATALSLPVAWLLTVAIALVFGWLPAALMVVVGATLGACGLYVAARWALADLFRAKAGKALNLMAAGFRDDAAGYLLFLRLTPVFPFALVNIVPAILGVPFFTYLWTTFFGIVPGTIAYALAGEGLRSIVGVRAAACAAEIAPCGTPLAAGDLITPQILIAFVGLGMVSLASVFLKRWRRARHQNSDQ